ncbi:MAG: regulatory iron-sulfur-containing complex subunit RicT [Candidatus Omnitrophota bacterium]
MSKIIEVKIGEFRPVVFFECGEVSVRYGDYVIVEVDRGMEYGQMVSEDLIKAEIKPENIEGKILRIATVQDLLQVEDNRKKAKEALKTCTAKIEESKVEMQITQCEYSFDGSKIIFFFTAEGRVDFRELVKDLAKIFRVRIELKQIGVRDKARIVGGYGICGREFCCSSYMKDFHPLTIKMSKDQNLPLNPSRISGVCGRIKCCMAYEFSVYREYAKDLPRVGEKITTPQGKGRVIDINILKRYALVDVGEGQVSKIFFNKHNDN